MNDINREVAEKVMGWNPSDHTAEWERPLHWKNKDGLRVKDGQSFEPSTNIPDAWLVVERMRELGFSLYLDNMTTGGVINAPYTETVSYWTAVFDPMYGNPVSPPPDEHFCGVAETAPLAIVLAALKAINDYPTPEPRTG